MSNQEFTYLQPHTHQAFKRIVRSRTSYVQKRTDMLNVKRYDDDKDVCFSVIYCIVIQ